MRKAKIMKYPIDAIHIYVGNWGCFMMKLYNELFQERAGGREKAAMEERLEKMQKEV